MRVMNFKNWLRKLNESIKDDELDRILDKIASKLKLTDGEKKFLDEYNSTSDDYYQDYSHLTKNDVCEKLEDLLSKGRKVICDLYDRDGKIGIEIKSIENILDEDSCFLSLKNGEKIEIKDNYFYNIFYDFRKDEHSLQSQEEFYEKIPVKDDN